MNDGLKTAIAVVAVIIILGIAFAFSSLNTPRSTPIPTPTPTPTPTTESFPIIPIVEPTAPSYIGNSSIYLLSANSSYGTYDGTPVFIVNVTVRNDYTSREPPPNNFSTENSTGEAYFILLANLYDKNGIQISSQEYIPAQAAPDYSQVSLSSGEIKSLTIYMATSNRNIDHYRLVFGFLGATPVP